MNDGKNNENEKRSNKNNNETYNPNDKTPEIVSMQFPIGFMCAHCFCDVTELLLQRQKANKRKTKKSIFGAQLKAFT